MTPRIQELDEMYKALENSIYPMHIDDETISSLEYNEYQRMSYEAEKLSERLFSILPSMSDHEIAEAYRNGCRLLQRNLSGYMARNFSDLYISVFEDAIEAGHTHTGWIFLQVLAEHNIDHYKNLVIKCLDVEGYTDTSIGIIFSFNIREACNELIQMTNNGTYSSPAFLLDVINRLNCQ